MTAHLVEPSIGISKPTKECRAVEDHAKGRFAYGELREVRDAPRRARGLSPAVAVPRIPRMSVGASLVAFAPTNWGGEGKNHDCSTQSHPPESQPHLLK